VKLEFIDWLFNQFLVEMDAVKTSTKINIAVTSKFYLKKMYIEESQPWKLASL